MSPKQFAALGVAAVASCVAAMMIFVAAKPWSPTDQKHEPMLPALRSDGSNVAAIEISRAEEARTLALSLQR